MRDGGPLTPSDLLIREVTLDKRSSHSVVLCPSPFTRINTGGGAWADQRFTWETALAGAFASEVTQNSGNKMAALFASG